MALNLRRQGGAWFADPPTSVSQVLGYVSVPSSLTCLEQVSINNGRFYCKTWLWWKNITYMLCFASIVAPWIRAQSMAMPLCRLHITSRIPFQICPWLCGPYSNHIWLRFHSCLNWQDWWSLPSHSAKCHSQHQGTSVSAVYSNCYGSVTLLLLLWILLPVWLCDANKV